MSELRNRWWLHERFDVCDTFKFRVAYVALIITPALEILIAAGTGHKIHLIIPFALYVIWALGIYLIMFRATHLHQRAEKLAWAETERQIRRRYGLEEQ